MSYQTDFLCVESLTEFAQYVASKHIGETVRVGDQTFSTSLQSLGTSSITYRYTNIATSDSFTTVIPFTPVDCFFPVETALQLGWMIAAALVAAACIRLLGYDLKARDQ